MSTVTLDLKEYNELRDFKRNLENKYIAKSIYQPWEAQYDYVYLNQECFSSEITEKLDELQKKINQYEKEKVQRNISVLALSEESLYKWSIWEFLKNRRSYRKSRK